MRMREMRLIKRSWHNCHELRVCNREEFPQEQILHVANTHAKSTHLVKSSRLTTPMILYMLF